MIVFMFGTTAELIKLQPVIDRCLRRSADVKVWCSAQQYGELAGLTNSSGDLAGAETCWLARGFLGQSITRKAQVVPWAIQVALGFIARALRPSSRPKLVIVHGDTLSTALGALLGKATRIEVAHIEAGLRSGDWRNPFPEELCRRIVGRIANLHFAPSVIAARNLEKSPGEVIATNGNTVIDSLISREGTASTTPPTVAVLVLLHRVEFLTNDDLASRTIRVLTDHARRKPVLIVLDALAEAHIGECLKDAILDPQVNLRITKKLPHDEFVEVLRRCELVVTDSGGLQEESAALGKPCIVHRTVSEREDGLHQGGNAVITGLDPERLSHYLDNPPLQTSGRLTTESPSDQIVETLAGRGFLATD